MRQGTPELLGPAQQKVLQLESYSDMPISSATSHVDMNLCLTVNSFSVTRLFMILICYGVLHLHGGMNHFIYQLLESNKFSLVWLLEKCRNSLWLTVNSLLCSLSVHDFAMLYSFRYFWWDESSVYYLLLIWIWQIHLVWLLETLKSQSCKMRSQAVWGQVQTFVYVKYQ